MPSDTRASLVLDAVVDAYVDLVAIAAGEDETTILRVKNTARFVAICALEAVLDFEDIPAAEQFDARLAALQPARRFPTWDEAMDFACMVLPPSEWDD